jgi:hypothetical protein
MISDMLRFLRMGFLLRKELFFEILLLLLGDVADLDRSEPVCSGP